MNATEAPQDGIAIIGMSGRFPGANSIEEFWQNLVKGVDCISNFTKEELEYSVATEDEEARGQKFVRARAILKDPDLFDAEFFGMYPKEAQITDPQHRLFLECAWEALERAGHAPGLYRGLIGVYGGLSMNTYLLNNLCANREFAANFAGSYQVGVYQTMLGNDKDFLPTRVSYKLNLRGPSMSVQCACSTSLVAICQACTSLMTFQCDMALAGGVSITFPQKRDYLYQEDAMVSADGTCRSFDADARGTVFGHGVAVVLLKRVEDAIADGDTILAVIKGTAINNDGSDKIGYAAPSIHAQAAVVAMAQAAADVHPDTISYIEAHGTATPLGDPIEITALTDAFRRRGSNRNQYCAVGTGKTNIGHLDVAAGATGLIKTVLQLQHEFVPSLLHFKASNPNIDFANSPFFPVSKPFPWKRGPNPRRAGVSAFGVGGTNAHVVVEEGPPALTSGLSRRHQLLLLSARSSSALRSMSERLAARLESDPDVSLADVAFTLQRGRQRFKHRAVLCVPNVSEAVEQLRRPDVRKSHVGMAPPRVPALVFLFPGQGSQHVNMGRELYECEPVFRKAVDRCADPLRNYLGLDIRSVLYPGSISPETAKQINETYVTQPATFVVEYALACLWRSWGVEPAMLVGHSVGEYVAAVMAGVFTLEDAISVLATRAKLMQDLPSGSMLAVRLGVEELSGLLPDDVAVAAINSPVLTTLSGPGPVLRELQEDLEKRKIVCRVLPTSHAFHSAMMDPIVGAFADHIRGVAQRSPEIPWVSSFTGTWMDQDAAPDAAYWANQLRHTVRFGQAVQTALEKGGTVFLEVGPGQALTQLVRQQPSKPEGLTLLSSLGPSDETTSDLQTMLTSLGRLWLLGLEPNWDEFYASEKRCRIQLPTYPFERKRFWIEPVSTAQIASPSVPQNAAVEDRREGTEPITSNSDVLATKTLTVSSALDGGSQTTRRVIEKQIQLMTQQLEMLRNRGVLERLQ